MPLIQKVYGVRPYWKQDYIHIFANGGSPRPCIVLFVGGVINIFKDQGRNSFGK